MATGKRKRRKRSSIKRTDKKQSVRFITAAKELGVDESGEAFERAFKELVRPKQPKGK